MATNFGYMVTGGTSYEHWEFISHLKTFTGTDLSTVDSITAYLTNTNAGDKVNFGLYSGSAVTTGKFLGSCQTYTYSETDDGALTLTPQTTLTLKNGVDYLITVQQNDNDINIWFDAGGDTNENQYIDNAGGSLYTYNQWENPSVGDVTLNTYQSTIHLTYSEPGGGPTQPLITNYNGCTASSSTTLTVSYAITQSSGNVTIYYGESDEGINSDNWDSNSDRGVKYNSDNETFNLVGLSPETDYYYRSFVSSNSWGGGEDWANETIHMKTADIEPPACEKGLLIYYNSLTGDDFICCECSRWDVQDYSMIIETWLTKSQLQTIMNNITPGATDELYKILGKPKYYDATWQGENTLKFSPQINYNKRLANMRQERIGYVKNFTSTPIEGNSGYLNVKFECFISGSEL